MLTKLKSSVWFAPVLCAVALVVCVAAAHPVVEMGLNDDWSYAFSARVLATTGHVVYNGWATAMLGWQLYWGALFIRVFGFSFLILRVSTLVLAVGTLALLQRIFVRVGVNVWNSTLATLTVLVSPIFFCLSFSFMSDIAGLLCLLLCVFLCLRALGAASDRSAALWLAAAALSNAGLGTVRQTSWLGALVLVPCAAWCLRRRWRGVWPVAGVAWGVSCGLIALCLHWFKLQPYVDEEKVFTALHREVLLPTVVEVGRSFLTICLFLLPVLLGFVVRFPWQVPRMRRMGVAAGSGLLLVAGGLLVRHRPVFWLAPFSGNTLTEKGFNDLPAALGERATVFPVAARAGLTLLVFAGLLAVVLCVGGARLLRGRVAEGRKRESEAPEGVVSWRTLAVFLGPFTLVYVFLLVTRMVLWDRYLLPLLPLALMVLLRFYQERISGRLPGVTLAAVAVFALFDVAALHDYFAQSRARLEAANNLQAMGVARTAINAGFEYSAWTQLELTGYVNDRRLHNPPGAYQVWVRPADLPHRCVLFFSDHTPSIAARYAVAYEPTTCLTPVAGAPPVRYRTWLPPHDQAIYSGLLP